MRRRLALVASVACVMAFAVPMNAFAESAGTSIVQNTPTIKTLNKNGTIPPQWNLPKPKAQVHPDVAPPSAGGVSGDGQNNMTFGTYDDGDMIVVTGTATGHCGEWDDDKYGSDYSKCVWSANTKPFNGVQLEQPYKYRKYNRAYGLWVPTLLHTKHVAARNYCRAQDGEPYVITSSKSDQSRWYCSKLLWGSYYHTAKVDLDADGGYWVWPEDILNDSQTKVFVSAS